MNRELYRRLQSVVWGLHDKRRADLYDKADADIRALAEKHETRSREWAEGQQVVWATYRAAVKSSEQRARDELRAAKEGDRAAKLRQREGAKSV